MKYLPAKKTSQKLGTSLVCINICAKLSGILYLYESYAN